jgi:hypothetical protein
MPNKEEKVVSFSTFLYESVTSFVQKHINNIQATDMKISLNVEG